MKGSLFWRLFAPVAIIMVVSLLALLWVVSDKISSSNLAQSVADGIIYSTVLAGLVALVLVFIAIFVTYKLFIGRKLNEINLALNEIANGVIISNAI